MSYFFFCEQKTAYEMRISDWSSDVCSSDLYFPTGNARPKLQQQVVIHIEDGPEVIAPVAGFGKQRLPARGRQIGPGSQHPVFENLPLAFVTIGIDLDRKSVV